MEEKTKNGRRYLYYSFKMPVWAFSKWPELKLGGGPPAAHRHPRQRIRGRSVASGRAGRYRAIDRGQDERYHPEFNL